MALKLSRRELGLAALAGTMMAQETPVEERLEDQALTAIQFLAAKYHRGFGRGFRCRPWPFRSWRLLEYGK